MAKITWLGEDGGPDQPGPPLTIWNGVTFPKGEPVEVADAHMIAKARGNRFFAVEDEAPVKRGPGRPPKPRDPGMD